MTNGTTPNGVGSTYSITALKRWSCGDKTYLPSKEQIKTIHVYDFDNTLFASPLPNKQLWAHPAVGLLMKQECFVNGGWWHDNSILAATGEGADKEEQRAWEGWWNEQIVQLVELSMQQKDALNVLLTGRNEANFGPLIKRILAAKKLEFGIIALKPPVGPNNQKFSSTMNFKQAFLADLIHTYHLASEIRVYEDRVKHVKGFREFFTSFNSALLGPDPPVPRKPITADVIHVPENVVTLDPTTEAAVVQSMINLHNNAIRSGTAPPYTRPYRIQRTVFFTAYLIPPATSTLLQSLVSLPQNSHSDIRPMANCIVISPRPAAPHLLTRVGGIGHKVSWRVTGIAVLENRVWAARVAPVNPREKIFTDTHSPLVVLALRRGSRPADATRIQNWQPVPEDKAFVFDATVGEKVTLRIEEETGRPHKGGHAGGNGEDGGVPLNTEGPPAKKPRLHEQDFISFDGSAGDFGPARTNGWAREDGRRPQAISANTGPRGGYGSQRGRGQYHKGPPRGAPSGGGRGGRGGGMQRGGRGRGGAHGGYRSLDDVGGSKGSGYADYDGAGGYANGYGGGGDGGLRYDY